MSDTTILKISAGTRTVLRATQGVPGPAQTDVLTTLGDVLTHDGASAIRLPIGAAGQLLTVVGGTVAWVAPPVSVPLTTVGDLVGFNGAVDRFPVGADDEVLVADSGEPFGFRWGSQPPGPPTAHATSHENGGTDEISVAGLSGLLADPQTPALHASTHENGGLDEINVAGLSGLLADPQTPAGHAATHLPGGSDPLTTAIAGTIQPDDTAAEGTALSFARSDHRHAIAAAAAAALLVGSLSGPGVSTAFARADHVHGVAAAAPVELADSANAEGVATTFARSDHVHAHGDRGGGTLHALVVAAGAAGFMSGADKTKLDGIPAGASDTWVGLTDTPGSITAGAVYRGNAGGTALEAPTGVSVPTTGNAIFLLDSTTQGLGIPDMTEAQRDLIPAVAGDVGLLIFNTDTLQTNQWTGATWTVPGAGLTTLQGAYDNDPSGAQILLNATPDPIMIQASVAGDVFGVEDVGGNAILNVTADPDEVEIDGRLLIADPFLNAGAANSIVMADTFTTGAPFIGGPVLSNGTVTYNNGVFIWALLQESKIYRALAAPGFAAFTLFNALAVIENGGNFDLVQGLILNNGLNHRRTTAGTSTVVQTIGLSNSPRTGCTVNGAVMRKTTGDIAVRMAPTYDAAAARTADLGTSYGLQLLPPAVALFGSGAGTIIFDGYIGVDFLAMTHTTGGDKVVIRSAMTDAADRFFLQNNGGARSDFGGGNLLDCGIVQCLADGIGLSLGAAGGDVQINWNGSALEFDPIIGDDLRIAFAAGVHTITTAAGTPATAQILFQHGKGAFGQTGTVGNQKYIFVANAETITVGGEFSQFLLTQSANDTIDAALTLYAGWTINAPNPTIGTGSLTTGAALNIGGNPPGAVNRVGLRILSNPSGGSGVNAALWITAGRSRFDGIVDINNGIALGGGAGATLGTIGGSGPTAAAQAQWVQIEVNGVNHWIPAWT